MALSISLSLMYLAFNIGLGVNVHYCGDRVSSVDFAFVGASCCCDAMEEPSDCCSDETFVFQSEDDQQASSNIQLSGLDVIVAGWVSPSSDVTEAQVSCPFANKGPPDVPGEPLFIRYSRLVLYG